jgi:hypothetical protein
MKTTTVAVRSITPTKEDIPMSRSTRFASLLFGVALLVGVTSSAIAADSMTVKLNPENNSGESGTATLTAMGKETKVDVTVNGVPAGVTQPMHIHKGTCDKLDPKPAFPLSPVKDGTSTTTVKASMDELMKGGYAINGHKSAQDIKTYVFCGNIAGM